MITERLVTLLALEIVDSCMRCEMLLHGFIAVEAFVAELTAVLIHTLVA